MSLYTAAGLLIMAMLAMALLHDVVVTLTRPISPYFAWMFP